MDKWENDMMEEDDPMVEDFEDDDDDDVADRMPHENARRMSLMRGSRAADFYRSYPDALDEKGESMAAMTPPEKLVHQSFFNKFPDDFDDDDLA